MIKAHSLYNGHHIDTDTFVKSVIALSEKGFEPIIYNLSKTLADQFGQIFNPARYFTISYFDKDQNVEYDFDDLLLVESFIKNNCIYIWFYQAEFHDEINPFSYISSGMTIYSIGEEENNDYNRLKEFGKIISEECLKSNHFNSYLSQDEMIELQKWVPQFFSSIKVSENASSYEKPKIKKFKEAEYSREEIELSYLFADLDIKKAIYLIAKSVKLRDEDMTSEFGKEKKERIVNRLKEENAVNIEKLVTCTKSKKFIATISDEIDGNAISKLKCATCHRWFKDEIITDVVSLTPICRNLLKSSNWMTILVTELFVQAGVNKSEIIWSLADRSDEIDIAFNYKNLRYVIELKDSDFEIGHAYALNYRSLKFEADQVIVIATGNISEEAVDLFSNVQRRYDEQFGYSDDPSAVKQRFPVLIPHFDGSFKSIQDFVKSSEDYEINEVLERFKSISKLDLGPIVYGYEEEE